MNVTSQLPGSGGFVIIQAHVCAAVLLTAIICLLQFW